MPVTLKTSDNLAIGFRIDWNDQAFVDALNEMKRGWGPTAVSETLQEAVEEQLIDTQKWLIRQAGALSHVTVPPSTKHAFVTIADSLTFTKRRSAGTYRIFSGPDYKVGVKGSRMLGKYGDVSLAKIHTAGANKYDYPVKGKGKKGLPFMVRSSVRHFSRTGNAAAFSTAMKNAMTHPGFPNTNTPQIDYTTHIEEGLYEKWPDAIHDKMLEKAKTIGWGI